MENQAAATPRNTTIDTLDQQDMTGDGEDNSMHTDLDVQLTQREGASDINLQHLSDLANCRQEIATFIESRMKEQYLEHQKALEQLQQRMQQQLVERQAELMGELHQVQDTNISMLASTNSTPTTNNVSHQPGLSEHSNHAISPDLGLPNGSMPTSKFTPPQTRLSSLDDDVNGNASHHSSQVSSHDTWDSHDALTHERPLLTGSERSTPTPVLGGSGDVELVSQSIHIPCDAEDEAKSVAVQNESVACNSSRLNQSGPSSTVELEPEKHSKPDLSQEPASPDELEYHSDSTTPPNSPADDLSASLRLSLRQKHSRHIADMKAYYEKELSDLKERLTSMLYITQHDSYLVLQKENQMLADRCRVLEQELIRSNRYISSVDQQMADLESSFNSSLQEHSKLDNEDLTTAKNKLTEAERHITSLEVKNRDLYSALCEAYEVRDNTAKTAYKDKLSLQELSAENERMQRDNQDIRDKLQSTEASLHDVQTELSRLNMKFQSIEDQKKFLNPQKTYLTTQEETIGSLLPSSDGNAPVLSPMIRAENKLEQSQEKNYFDHNQNNNSGMYEANKDSRILYKAHKEKSQSRKHSPKADRSRLHASRSTLPKSSGSEEKTMAHELINAYSPSADRHRHSSSASSGTGTKGVSSPLRQSTERPFGFHHMGASSSPSRKAKQWTSVNKSPKRTGDLSPARHTGSPRKNLTSFLAKASEKYIARETVLEQVKTKKIFVDPVDSKVKAEPDVAAPPNNESVRQTRIQLIKDAQTRLDELLIEKRELEATLSRLSTKGVQERQRQESLESQLDRIDRDLGSVRMTLRRHNAI